ncbi:MAG: BBP7 family outer membrane beta-barrel protein [Gemmata sp.]
MPRLAFEQPFQDCRTPVELDAAAPARVRGLWWATGDYLLWQMRSAALPPLVARDVPGTPQALVGVPGTAGQQTLFGGSNVNGDLRSGLRLRGGFWFDDTRLMGLDGEFFYLGGGGDGGRFASPGTPPLSRPFLNAGTGAPDAQLVAFPDLLAGAVSVETETKLYGFAPALRCNLAYDCDSRIDVLVGYRNLWLDDRLRVTENLNAIGPGAVQAGTNIIVQDTFRAVNNFNGGLLGLAGGKKFGNMSLNARGSVSFGQTFTEATIDWQTLVTPPGGPTVLRAGGLLAQRSNGGRHEFQSFAVVPELGFDLGYQITPNLRAQVGYTFLYWSSVARAGDQVDRVVDPVQLTGATSSLGRPAFNPNRTDFWAQGVNFGLTIRY